MKTLAQLIRDGVPLAEATRRISAEKLRAERAAAAQAAAPAKPKRQRKPKAAA